MNAVKETICTRCAHSQVCVIAETCLILQKKIDTALDEIEEVRRDAFQATVICRHHLLQAQGIRGTE